MPPEQNNVPVSPAPVSTPPQEQVPTPPPAQPQIYAPASTYIEPPTQPSSNSKIPKTLGIIIALIILIVGGLVAYAFVAQVGPFERAPYDTQMLASSIFGGASKINGAGYAVSVAVVSEPKDADAVSFEDAVPVDQDHVMAYKRDQDRARNVQTVLRNLMMKYGYSNKSYPSVLNDDIADSVARSSVTYNPSRDGKDFALTVSFETTDAVDSIRTSVGSRASSTSISGTRVTFTKASNYYFYLPQTIKQPAIIDVAGMQSSLSYIPANFKFDGMISGASTKTSEDNVDGKVKFIASADMSDMTVALDVEVRKVADNIFLMINKFPSFFGDISKIKAHWVRLTPEDLAVYGAGYFGTSANSASKDMTEKKQQAIDAIKIFLSVADKNHAFISKDKPVKEEVNGVSVYRYDLTFNKDTLASFYQELTDQLAEKFADKNPLKFDQATMDYLKSPQFSGVFDYFSKNTTLSLWAGKDGIPVQVRYGLRLVPSSEQKNVDKQLRTTFTLTLSDINKPITIEKPEKTMSVEEVTMLMTGQTKEQYTFSKQTTAVRTVRNALETYKQLAGSYPTSLSGLTKTRGDIKKLNSNSTKSPSDPYAYSYSYGKDTDPILATVPMDAFTTQSFGYSSITPSDYTLTFTQHLPPYVKGTMPAAGIYSQDYMGKKITVGLVDGVNTADAKNLSREALAATLIDTDKDGVPDLIEKYIGTDPNKKDSDSDGYSDYQELQQGSDPLGPGNLKGSYGGYGGMMY